MMVNRWLVISLVASLTALVGCTTVSDVTKVIVDRTLPKNAAESADSQKLPPDSLRACTAKGIVYASTNDQLEVTSYLSQDISEEVEFDDRPVVWNSLGKAMAADSNAEAGSETILKGPANAWQFRQVDGRIMVLGSDDTPGAPNLWIWDSINSENPTTFPFDGVSAGKEILDDGGIVSFAGFYSDNKQLVYFAADRLGGPPEVLGDNIWVSHMASFSDGHVAALVRRENETNSTIQIWKPAESLNPIRVIDENVMSIHALPGDQLAATTGGGNRVLLFDLTKPDSGPVRIKMPALLYSMSQLPDGRLVSGHDSVVGVGDPTNPGKPVIFELPNSITKIQRPLALANGLIAAATETEAVLLNPDNPSEVQKLPAFNDIPQQYYEFRRVGETGLAARTVAGEMHLWNLDDLSAKPDLLGRNLEVLGRVNNGDVVMSVKSGVRVWNADTADGASLNQISALSGLSRLGDDRIAAGAADGSVHIWNWRNPAVKPIAIKAHKTNVTVTVALDDGRLASGSEDGSVAVFVPDSSTTPVSRYAYAGGAVLALAALRGNRIAVAGSDGHIAIYDLKSADKTPRFLCRGEGTSVLNMATLASGKLAVAAFENRLRVYDVDDSDAAAVTYEFPEVAHDGISAGADGSLYARTQHHVWSWNPPDAGTTPEIIEVPQEVFVTFEELPDGKFVTIDTNQTLSVHSSIDDGARRLSKLRLDSGPTEIEVLDAGHVAVSFGESISVVRLPQ